MKFGICNEIFQGWELETAMKFARETGYSGIELAPFTLARSVTEISQTQRRQIRDAAGRTGLEIIGLHWLLAKTEGLHLSHPDPSVRQRTSQYMRDLVDCGADLCGKILVLGSPQQRNILPGDSAEAAWERSISTLKEAVKCAESRGVTLCIEPLSPGETNFLNTARETIEFVEQIASPAVKLILDVKAMCSESQSIPQIIDQTGPRFAHFHANDRNLKGPGFGSIDFLPIAEALAKVKYNGYVSVEVFKFDEGPETIAQKSFACLQRAFARHGL
jgi:sugar phosphate isomerase/epimerase